MKTLLSLLLLTALCSPLSAAEPRVLFRTEFSPDGSVREVRMTLVSKDAEGFSTSRALRPADLPDPQRAQFATLQAALTASASAGGWRLTSGELAQTGSTSDFQEVAQPPSAVENGAPATIRVPIPGTERPVLTLWQTQTREGRLRYQTVSSESWPPGLRAAVLALWAWLSSQP